MSKNFIFISVVALYVMDVIIVSTLQTLIELIPW